MPTPHIQIDFNRMAQALHTYVRRRAKTAGSHIVYVRNGIVVREHPQTGQHTSQPLATTR